MLRHMRRALLQRRVTQGARLRTRQFVQMHSESNHMEESLSRHSTGPGGHSLVRLQLERRAGERCDPIFTIEVSEVNVTAMHHQACHESRTCVWWQSHLQGRERTHSIFPKNCAPSNDVIALSERSRELRGSVRSVNAHARPEYNGC